MIKKLKLGKCQKTGQENARIWLENKKLSENGFTPNSYYACEWKMGKVPALILTVLNEDDIAAEIRKVTDKKGTSVIDLTGWVVKQFFEGFTHYTVEYQPGEIIIKGAK